MTKVDPQKDASPRWGDFDAERLLRELIPAVEILIQDYCSGLPEDHLLVDAAVALLSQLLEDEEGNLRPEFIYPEPAFIIE